MSESSLHKTLTALAEKARRYRGRRLGEQNTKASLIEPILEALGWDIRDPDEVHREFRPMSKDCPVDYALKLLRKPRLFVEAKGLDEELSDRKWIAQILSYATVAGVEWCVLTDGDNYRIYNSMAPVDAEEKLFLQVRLSESAPETAAEVLGLISRRNLEDNLIEVMWSEHFVDRRVREALEQIIESVDKGMVRMIRSRHPKLSSRQIAESVRRLDVSVSQTSFTGRRRGTELDTPKSEVRRRSKSVGTAGSKQAKDKKVHVGVTLQQIIESGVLRAPVRLFRDYKGHALEAHLKANGSVTFKGEEFASCSTAGEKARGSVIGGTPHTNGWTFWQYRDSQGSVVLLDAARQEYLRREGSPALRLVPDVRSGA